MTKLSVTAYAKVNLSLFITGQREDGCHLLDMVMQNISLADTLLLEEAKPFAAHWLMHQTEVKTNYFALTILTLF